MKQQTLFKMKDYSSEFGGDLLAGRRKTARPLSNKNPLHLVLRADTKKFGSFLKHRALIERHLKNFAAQFDGRIYKQALVSNHIHLVLLFRTRASYTNFIRAFCGTIARLLKVKWLKRPWSRILAWGRAYKIALAYVKQNHREAMGEILYQNRRRLNRTFAQKHPPNKI
ncbi:MAG: transposase [Bdellovibrionota bacterium]